MPVKQSALANVATHPTLLAAHEKLQELRDELAMVDAALADARKPGNVEKMALAILDGTPQNEPQRIDVSAMQQRLAVLERAITLQQQRIETVRRAAQDDVRKTFALKRRQILREVDDSMAAAVAALTSYKDFKQELANAGCEPYGAPFRGPQRFLNVVSLIEQLAAWRADYAIDGLELK